MPYAAVDIGNVAWVSKGRSSRIRLLRNRPNDFRPFVILREGNSTAFRRIRKDECILYS